MSDCIISSLIRSQDLLGHQIKLDFDKQGHTYRTCLGGCVSLFIKLLIFLFAAQRILIMVLSNNNLHQEYVRDIDYEQVGNLTLSSADKDQESLDFLPIFQFLHTESMKPFTQQSLENQGMSKFITMNYIDVKFKKTRDGATIRTTNKLPVRLCT